MIIYVASTKDPGDGSLAKPFGTLREARDAVRERLAQNRGDSITVEVGAGSHILDEPLIFDHTDSGTPGVPVIWRGAPGETTIISAGRRLDCAWEKYQNGILQCSIGHQIEGKSFSQLYINGKRQVLARFPNGDTRNPDKNQYATATGADEWPHSEVYYAPEGLPPHEWSHPEEAILHIFPQNHWGNTQYKLKWIDRDRRAFILGEGGWQIRNISSSAAGIGDRSEYFVENVFEELDAPGEWYYNMEKGILYWYPEDEADPETAEVYVSANSSAIRLAGTRENPVHDISFVGLQFAHTERTFLESYEIPSMGDWAIHRNGSIYISGADTITVERCRFEGIGGNAVFVDGYAAHISISNSTFHDIGESAVCFVGESHLNLEGTSRCAFCGEEHTWSWDTPSDNHPIDCDVSNNLIHDIGVFGKQTAGVFTSLSQRISIRHNHIYNTPRAAICLNDGMYGGHVVEFNDIHDTVRETGDHGPFNSWGREPFWCHAQGHGQESHPAGNVEKFISETSVIRHNRFRDSSGWGIDLDDGSSLYHVYGNLCIGISVKLREGVNRLVENNIFYKPVNPPAFHRGYENNNDRYLCNIVVMDSGVDVPEVDANFRKGKSEGAVYDIIAPPLEGSWFSVLDRNLFFSDIGHFKALVHRTRKQPSTTVEYSFDEWQELGYDARSLFADPMFANPENGDFRLLSESPAIALGFREFPLDRFGIQ